MTDVLVDYLATARRVLASPEGVYSLTPHEAVALAACTVRESTGMMPDLPRVAEAGPVFPASLAVAVAQLIQAYDALQGADDLIESWAATNVAFNTLKTRFEQEFPNV